MQFDYAKISSPKQRAKILVHTRNLKMARNAHAYVRGSTVKFYEWLQNGGRKLPAGPSVWICGDCHLGNLGPLADADGHVDVQIRDLDQTVIQSRARSRPTRVVVGVGGARVRSAGRYYGQDA